MGKSKPDSVGYRKKLIEVALPLEAINVASAKEKSIRHGHPSTLHLWWARRPLAACRAVLFASLVDDPSSDPMFAGDEDIEASKRAELFNLIEELVQWDNSDNPRVINKVRAEIARCIASRRIETGEFKKDQAVAKGTTAHDLKQMLASSDVVNEFLAHHAPPVLDPFCGGGSIPLEAQRLGLRAYASDLNPVPVLITKALIEIPSRFSGLPPVNPDWQRTTPQEKAANVWTCAQGISQDVRYYGKWIRDEAEKRIGQYYPQVKITSDIAKKRPDLQQYIGTELPVLAWLWTRTVECPNPGCRARTPLVRSFWVSKKKGRERYAYPLLNRTTKTLTFEIRAEGTPPKHTTDRTGARCLFCDTFIKKPQLREIACDRHVREIPFAIVAEGNRERVYLPGDIQSPPDIEKLDCSFLDEPITNDRRWFSPPLYGLTKFADLFTPRQLLTLKTVGDLVGEARCKIIADGKTSKSLKHDERTLADGGSGTVAYADAVVTYLSLGLAKLADRNSSLCSWEPGMDRMRSTFGRQALPIVWDYTETNPLADAAGDIYSAMHTIAKVLERLPTGPMAQVSQLDATATRPNVTGPLISSDPPYYDNIGYAELAWQLGGKEGYKLVKEADETATNPGDALTDLFNKYAPCLILIDEWVAYDFTLRTSGNCTIDITESGCISPPYFNTTERSMSIIMVPRRMRQVNVRRIANPSYGIESRAVGYGLVLCYDLIPYYHVDLTDARRGKFPHDAWSRSKSHRCRGRRADWQSTCGKSFHRFDS